MTIMRSQSRLAPLLHPRRLLSSTSRPHATSPFASPAPPRLPKEDQELYERLQRSSTGAFSTPKTEVVTNQSHQTHQSSNNTSRPQQRSRPQINQSPFSSPTPGPTEDTVEGGNEGRSREELERLQGRARVEASGEGEELHPNVRRGALPEFEGERNPKTGETGGPKNEPLRWGGGVDWSYNGRVTDF